MKKIIVLLCVVMLVVISSMSFAAGDKVQERNPEIRGDVNPPVMRQLVTNGDV